MLDKKFINKLALETRTLYRKLVFDPAGGGKGAKDVYGKDYKKYSSSYKTAKESGELKRQSGKFKDSQAPVLSGDLLNAFDTLKTDSTGFGFGAIGQRGKIKRLNSMGRAVSTNEKPVPDEVVKFIMKEMDKDVKGAFKKIKRAIKRKKININIGK